MTPTAVTGSAERWGPLWGARPADWALSEDQQVPNYEDALARVGLEPGQTRARRRLRRRGVPALGRRARRAPVWHRCLGGAARRRTLATARCRSASWRHGGAAVRRRHVRSRHRLHVVLLRQRHRRRPARGGPRRQARRGGRHQRLGPARGQRPRGGQGDHPALLPAPPRRRAGRARLLRARRAGGHRNPGRPRARRRRSTPRGPMCSRMRETVRRAMVAPAGLALLVGPDREDEVKDAIERGLASYRADDGSYRLQNTFHSLIARAR